MNRQELKNDIRKKHTWYHYLFFCKGVERRNNGRSYMVNDSHLNMLPRTINGRDR